jgi:hypothetical protein
MSATNHDQTADHSDIDHLTEDLEYSNGLKYAAISFCASRTRQKYDNSDGKVAVRVRGGFHGLNDAKKHMRLLDRKLDTYITELYKWILIGNVDETMDANAHLNDMIRAHTRRLEHEKQVFEKRKKAAMEGGLDSIPDELKSEHDKVVADTVAGGDPKSTLDSNTLDTIVEIDDEPDDMDGISLSDVDTVKTGDYKFVAISYVLPDAEFQELETPDGVVALKIRAIFETRDEGEKYLKETLSKVDPDHDILLADMYKFLILPADHSKLETTYREEYLQEMFSGYDESQKAAKSFSKEHDRIGDLEKAVHPAEMKAIDDGASGSGT